MTHYGPQDKWLAHPAPHYTKVWKQAKGRGWSMDYNTSHQTYTLTCPSGDCQELVFKSGKGGETYSKQVEDTIRNCMHGPGQQDQLQRAIELLDQAERLIDGAYVLIERDRVEIQAARALDADDWLAARTEEVFQQFAKLTEEAEGLLGKEICEPAEALARAGDPLQAARDELYPFTDADDVLRERRRLKRLRERVVEARKLIAIS